MEYTIFGTVIVLWVWIVYYLVGKSFDGGIWPYAMAVWFIITLSVVAYGADKAGEKGPCVESEIQMHYNAATKTMMPAKVCINKGEWIKDE